MNSENSIAQINLLPQATCPHCAARNVLIKSAMTHLAAPLHKETYAAGLALLKQAIALPATDTPATARTAEPPIPGPDAGTLALAACRSLKTLADHQLTCDECERDYITGQCEEAERLWFEALTQAGLAVLKADTPAQATPAQDGGELSEAEARGGEGE